MKKNLYFFLFFFLPFYLEAFSVGNPAAPSILQEGFFFSDEWGVAVKAGIEARVMRRDFLRFHKHSPFSFCEAKKEGYSLLASLIFDVKERFDFYWNIGVSEEEIHFQSGSSHFCAKSGTKPYFMGGARVILLEFEKATLGADGKYGYFSSHEASLSERDSSFREKNLKWISKGWQVALALSYQIGPFIPYLGANVREIKTKITSISNFLQSSLYWKTKRKAGLFLGASLSSGSFLSFTIEADLISDLALYTSFEVRF